MATEVSTPVVAAPQIGSRRKPRPIPEGGRVNWGLTIIIAIVSLIVIIPLYFAIAMALKSPAQTGTGTGFNFPWPIHWGNFRAAWDLTNTPLAFSMSPRKRRSRLRSSASDRRRCSRPGATARCACTLSQCTQSVRPASAPASA